MAKKTTKVLVTAIDAIVNVNTLFTATVFLGISFTTTASAADSITSCKAGPTTVKRLVAFEIASFSCYLFSSMVAQGLKLHVSILNSADREDAVGADVDQFLLNSGVVGSGIGSAAGCVFLMLAMVNVIQIRLGVLSCETEYAAPTAAAMVVLVSSALLIYICCVFHALKKVYFELLAREEEDLNASNSDYIELKEPELLLS